MADHLVVWGFPVPSAALSRDEQEYLRDLPDELPPVEWLWSEMDRVWHSMDLDNTAPFAGQPIDDFYRHPVWVANGIFTAIDPDSVRHRRAIADYCRDRGARHVADYGGGFGELARVLTDIDSLVQVDIVEPYPSRVGLERLADRPRVKYVSSLLPNRYDVVIAQDVLEHVEEPLVLAADLAEAVVPGGVVIYANAFEPMIECHLPANFYLRRTFPLAMRMLGLTTRGHVQGAEHALVFEVGPSIRRDRIQLAERLAKSVDATLGSLSRVAPHGARRVLGSLRRSIIK